MVTLNSKCYVIKILYDHRIAFYNKMKIEYLIFNIEYWAAERTISHKGNQPYMYVYSLFTTLFIYLFPHTMSSFEHMLCALCSILLADRFHRLLRFLFRGKIVIKEKVPLKTCLMFLIYSSNRFYIKIQNVYKFL